MICRRHAETDQALDFCKENSLLLALDTETPQDQLKIASRIVIDTFQVWKDEVASNVVQAAPADVAAQRKQLPPSKPSITGADDPFADDAFGQVVSVAIEPSVGDISSSSSSSSSSVVVAKNESSAPPKDNHQQQNQSKIFRAPAYFFTVGFLRLRRLAHSRFRLRDILKRYMKGRREFLDNALEQWREVELAARINVSFDEYVLVYVPPAQRRQVLVDYHRACCHQTLLFIRAIRGERGAQAMQLRKTFFVWAYHQRKVSSTTFRIAVVTLLIFQERARKRAWVRRLLGQNAYKATPQRKGSGAANSAASSDSAQAEISFGRNSRVASLLLSGCTAPTKWCQSLLNLQSLAWCCAVRRHKFQLIIDNRRAFFYSDLSKEAKLLMQQQKKKDPSAAATEAAAGEGRSNNNNSSALTNSRSGSSTSSLSSLASSTETQIELEPASLALIFAPWVHKATTATWFSIHLQKFALRQLPGAHQNATTVLVEQLRERMQKRKEEHEQEEAEHHQKQQTEAASEAAAATSASEQKTESLTMEQRLAQQRKFHTAPASAVEKTEQLWAKIVLAPELFAPFHFVDLHATSSEEKSAAETMRSRLVTMESEGSFRGFSSSSSSSRAFMTSVRDVRSSKMLETANDPNKLKEEYVFRGRRHFEEKQPKQPSSPRDRQLSPPPMAASPIPRANSPDVVLGADGALVSAKKKTVQISTEDPKAGAAPGGRGSPSLSRSGSPTPTKGQLFSQKQLRKSRRAELEYTHGDGDNVMVFTTGSPLHRLKYPSSASSCGSSKTSAAAAAGGGSAHGASPRRSLSSSSLLPQQGSFRRRVNTMLRSSSLRLPSSRSFRGIHSAFTSVAAGQPADKESGLSHTGARCPTLWGSLWQTDPHWQGDVENTEALFFNPESLYRKVLRLAVVTGALRITDPYLYRRLERVNQMMVAARMREVSQQERTRAQRQRKRQQNKRKSIKQEQGDLSGSLPPPPPRSGRRSPSPKKIEDREEESSRMMWTPKRRREPVVVCPLFGQISDLEPADVLDARRHEAADAAQAMARAMLENSSKQMSSSSCIIVAGAERFKNEAMQQGRFLTPTAPVFMAAMRPTAPRSAKRRTSAAGQEESISSTRPSSSSSGAATSRPGARTPAQPLTSRQTPARPRALCGPNSTLATKSANTTGSTSTICTRIVEANSAAVEAENQRCIAAAPAPPPQKDVRAIVRGAAANRKKIVETRATSKSRSKTPIASASPAAGNGHAQQEQQQQQQRQHQALLPTSRKQGVFVIEKSELHERRPDWTGRELPAEAPEPFGFSAGFPAMFKLIEGRAGLGTMAAPPKHHL